MESLHESGEDYLEAIVSLENDKGEVRSVDVANKLAVSRSSVNKAVAALKKSGMVTQEHYGNIFLTEKGRKIAKEMKRRHDSLHQFFKLVIGVDSEIAEAEACRMEHFISEETFAGFERLLSEWKDKNS